MILSIIAAVARNGVIGRNGALPWRLPADLKHFKSVTMGKPVIMGRRTWESLGKPLPGRMNIVVTSRRDLPVPCAGSLDEALRLAASADEVFVIGGARLFAEALARASRLYLTEIDADFDGDTWFPPFRRTEWSLVSSVGRKGDETNPIDLTFRCFERIMPSPVEG
jgi:dihydrofolate reductase